MGALEAYLQGFFGCWLPSFPYIIDTIKANKYNFGYYIFIRANMPILAHNVRYINWFVFKQNLDYSTSLIMFPVALISQRCLIKNVLGKLDNAIKYKKNNKEELLNISKSVAPLLRNEAYQTAV